MRCRIAHQGLIALVAIGVGACSTPDHSNVLIFATNTKVALDVAVAPTTSTPEITLGYKRQEGVWMPLTPNVGSTKERTSAKCEAGVEKCGFIGTQTDTKDGDKRDAYSVLASFGANFTAGAQGPGSQGPASTTAGGGLAQFFATGIAAQKLADAGGARLVSYNSNDSLTEKKVSEALAKAPSPSDELLKAKLPLSRKFGALSATNTTAAKADLDKFDTVARAAGYPKDGQSDLSPYGGFKAFLRDTDSQLTTVTAIRTQLEQQGITFN